MNANPFRPSRIESFHKVHREPFPFGREIWKAREKLGERLVPFSRVYLAQDFSQLLPESAPFAQLGMAANPMAVAHWLSRKASLFDQIPNHGGFAVNEFSAQFQRPAGLVLDRENPS